MREHAELMKLRTASGKAQDPEFKATVEQANAKIKQHLQMAQDLARSS